MKIIHSPDGMRSWSADQKKEGLTIGLVPTMGFFHEGHLSLMRAAADLAGKVVVTLFVNPIQFGPGEDLDTYPRNFDRDCKLAGQAGADVLFAPRAADMYPGGFRTTVSVSGITRHLCGAARPGHFDGVATVVAKLFNITGADKAVFGEKDFQQLAVIRRMVEDLNIPIEIFGHPIVREDDGLAMSSRNAYLEGEERRTALCLSRSLLMAREEVASGKRDADDLAEMVREYILSFAGTSIDYVSCVDRHTLEPVAEVDENTLLALAVRINNKVRLIDNCMLSGEGDLVSSFKTIKK